MTARVLDGATVTIAGRGFTAVDEPPDEDGHGWFGFVCDTCGESGKASWAEDHECPPACPECGQRDEDARTEAGAFGYFIWRCCGQELRCACGEVTNTVHRSVCTAWVTP
jgi:hypothetical protein